MRRPILVSSPFLLFLVACASSPGSGPESSSILDVIDNRQKLQLSAGPEYSAASRSCPKPSVAFCVSAVSTGPAARCSCMSEHDVRNFVNGSLAGWR